MSAVGAFDGACRVLGSHDDALHFTELRCSKHASQSRHSTTFAASTVQSLLNQLLVVALQYFAPYSVSFRLRFIIGEAAKVCRKLPQQPFADIRVELRFELGPIDIMAADHEAFKLVSLDSLLEKLCRPLVMAAHFVFRVPLGMAGIVACVPVAPTTAREGRCELIYFA